MRYWEYQARENAIVRILVLSLLANASSIFVLAGCAQMGGSHLAAQTGIPMTVEDQLDAALMYEEQAQQLELEALKFEDEHGRITTHEDPKGFRRSALKIAAQRCRKEGADLHDLAVQYRQQAEEQEKKRGG